MEQTATTDLKAQKRKEATQRYYQNHKEEIIARNRAWLENDPTGEKKKKARIRSMKSVYKKKPTIARAISIYALIHDKDKNSISVSVDEVKKEIDRLVLGT